MEPTAVQSDGGPVALPQPEIHPVTTSDGTADPAHPLRHGQKGPVVLAPGYGNAARAFALDTVPKNYTQYLGEHGYDVWLLDYRASPDLPSSFTQFTVDDIAMRDWPAAIAQGPARDRRGVGAGARALRRRALALHGDRRRHGRACARRLSPRWPAIRSRRWATGCAPRPGWRRYSGGSGSSG